MAIDAFTLPLDVTEQTIVLLLMRLDPWIVNTVEAHRKVEEVVKGLVPRLAEILTEEEGK